MNPTSPRGGMMDLITHGGEGYVKMRRIHTDDFELRLRGVARYELANGQRIDLDARAVELYGAAAILREYGLAHLVPTERVKVVWCGKEVGTLPGDFDPSAVRSKSSFYDPRPGDFQCREGGFVEAARSLGPRDLESVEGFAWNQSRGEGPSPSPCPESER